MRGQEAIPSCIFLPQVNFQVEGVSVAFIIAQQGMPRRSFICGQRADF